MYGVGAKLLILVQSFYTERTVCVEGVMDVSECIQVNVGLKRGCVMSPWLFNVYLAARKSGCV